MIEGLQVLGSLISWFLICFLLAVFAGQLIVMLLQYMTGRRLGDGWFAILAGMWFCGWIALTIMGWIYVVYGGFYV